MSTPMEVLTTLHDTNPTAAKFIYGGLGVFAAVAMVQSFRIDMQTAIFVGVAILAFALIVLALSNAGGVLTTVVGWGVSILLLASMTAFVYAASVADPSPIRPVECLVRFWEKCESVQDQVAVRNEQAVTVQNITSPPVAPTVDKSKFTVLIQFAGYRREDIVDAAKALKLVGWKIPMVDKGGERTPKAAGLSEVRYRSDAEAAAAELLATEIEKTGIKADVKVVKVPAVGADQLEVWISL